MEIGQCPSIISMLWGILERISHCQLLDCLNVNNALRASASERIQRPWGERGLRGPLRAKGADTFQGLEIKFEKLLLLMRPRDLQALGIMRPLAP